MTTAADQIINSNKARQLFSLDGNGIKVGIISDSFNSLSGLGDNIKSGDLPGNDNPNGFNKPVQILSDSSESLLDEGRALGQIVHDIAPGAELFFHTFTEENENGLVADEDSFAKAVSNLVDAGVDIIVEDAVIAAPLLQDGKAVQAIDDATNQGVVVVSAAGNDGGIAYESEFRPGNNFEIEGLQFQAHDFDPTNAVDVFQDVDISTDSAQISALLGWDDPIGKLETEYVQFLVNTPELPNLDNIVAVSGLTSNSSENTPLRRLDYAPEKDEQLYFVIAKVRSDVSAERNTLKWVSTANGADRNIDYEYIDESANNRSVFGNRNAPSSITVGATNIDNPTEIRSYSSRGGVPILLDSQGQRLENPVLRNKPTIYAPDGVSVNFPQESPLSEFFGTSAAAPHIAGVIALMQERLGTTISPEQVRNILENTALPISSDAGLAQADDAVINSYVSKQSGSPTSDTLYGTKFADNLYGKKGNDRLLGRAGFDYLLGGEGADTLSGGQGNDLLSGGAGDDSIRGGAGDDTVLIHNFNGIDTFDGGIGNDSIRFEPLDDRDLTIYLDKGHVGDLRTGGQFFKNFEKFFTGQGNDHLQGNHQNNYFDGNDGNDTLKGAGGSDTLLGSNGHDELIGGRGQDQLVGSVGNDTLIGGRQSDHLNGGKGDDLLIGGKSNDTFLFERELLDGVADTDTIANFQQQDELDFTGYLRGGGSIETTRVSSDFLSIDLTQEDIVQVFGTHTGLDTLESRLASVTNSLQA